MSRNSVTAAAAVKLTIFTAASLVVTSVLAAIMGNFGFGATNEYHAVFASASMLQKGDDVRVAGVNVGEVKDVEILDRTRAEVSFTAKSGVALTSGSRAEIRYLNLVGDRYLALERGGAGGTGLPDGGTIPIEHTSPALNLTALFNGFQPLFAALNPTQVNRLSMNLIRTFQGEGGTIQSLMAHTASLTNTLADRDQLIGQVVNNLDTMLGTVDSRHQQLSQLVVQLRRWLGGLARDRHVIGTSLTNISSLTRETADLLTRGRPYLKSDIAQLRTLMTTLSEPGNEKVLTDLLRKLPEGMRDQARTGTYGSWYQYYLCDFKGNIILPEAINVPGLQKQLNDFAFHSTAARCDV